MWLVLTQLALCAIASAQTPSVTLRVASENAPAGGWAQIKVYADAPALIANGVLALDLDPLVFGRIDSVASFSAAGDVMGMATVDGTHVEVSLHAPSGGIGQLPGVPVFTVRASVLDTAQRQGFLSLSLPAGPPVGPYSAAYPADAWTDPAGNPYQVTLVSGRFGLNSSTVSVENITPGGGFQPVGTVLHIDGTGFDEHTQVAADGVVFSSVMLVSSTRIDATLASSLELTGAHFRVGQLSNSPIDFFPSLPSAPAPGRLGENYIHVILPLTERRSFALGGAPGGLSAVLLNPSQTAVDLRVVDTGPSGEISGRVFSVPPRGLLWVQRLANFGSFAGFADGPLRIAQFSSNNAGLRLMATSPAIEGPIPQQFSLDREVSVEYQTGTPNPAPKVLRAFYRNVGQDASVAVSAGSWLTVTTRKDPFYTELTLAFNTAGLAPGKYTGTVTVTPLLPSLVGFTIEPNVVRVTLNVSTQPAVTVQSISSESSPLQFSPSGFSVGSNGSPAPFTITTETFSGGDWLATDITSGVSPATVSFRAKPNSLPVGYYDGRVTIQGPVNRRQLDVRYYVNPLTPPVKTLQANPPTLSFIRESGTSGLYSGGFVSFSPATTAVSLKIHTDDGGDWLKAFVFGSIPGSGSVDVNVDAVALLPGTYHGTITGTAGGESAQTQVTLTVTPRPQSPLTITPSALTFSTQVNVQSPKQTVSISSPEGSVLYSVQTPPQLLLLTSTSITTPSNLTLAASSDTPGTYRGVLSAVTSTGKVSIPVVVYVTAAADAPPVISSVTSTASNVSGPLAPGELITIRGLGVGPERTTLTLDSDGKVTTDIHSDTRVLINGNRAPIVYASPEQWNVIVPYEVDGLASATLQVISGGVESKTWTLPVAPAAPAVFTIGSTGIGRGAVLNQDNTVNSPTNPAPRGTVFQIFATGLGQNVPASATGTVTSLSGDGHARLPVKVFIGGAEAPVVFAGPAPGFVSGVAQINAVIPSPLFGATAVQVILEVNGVMSQPGVAVTLQ